MADDHHEHAAPPRPESSPDGVRRRGFLECRAWAGTGLAWTVAGRGLPHGGIR
jgi:hypothetical protein